MMPSSVGALLSGTVRVGFLPRAPFTVTPKAEAVVGTDLAVGDGDGEVEGEAADGDAEGVAEVESAESPQAVRASAGRIRATARRRWRDVTTTFWRRRRQEGAR
jgi:hypothetical protein